MTRGRKPGLLTNARDANGWMIPREGTIRRQVYETMIAGMDRAAARAKLGISATEYRLHRSRIINAEPALLPKKGACTRPCMCCRKPFESEWIGNRLCVECASESVEGPQFNRYGAGAGAVG